MNTPITITLNKIKEKSPCLEGWAKVLKANGGTKADLDKPFPVSSILDSNDLDDTLWVLRCLPEHDRLWRKFAWWNAKSVSNLAKDPRVDECLDVVDRYINGLATDAELVAARSAARAAARTAPEGAAWASEAASGAAWAAADEAAWAAARSAARAAARTASEAAAWASEAAARSAQENKLRSILDAGRWVD